MTLRLTPPPAVVALGAVFVPQWPSYRGTALPGGVRNDNPFNA